MTSLLQRYFSQPDGLPAAAWALVQDRLPGSRLCRVALTDLSPELQFCERWLVLTVTHLVLCDVTAGTCSVVPHSRVHALVLHEGVSSHRLTALDAAKKPLLQVQFTRRQSRAVADLQMLADGLRDGNMEVLGGGEPRADAADAAYREAVLKSLEEARASLNVPTLGTLLRLLSYLGPHRRAVAVGFVLAVVFTCLQLMPPYLTKVLVDDVLQPVEKGTLAEPLTSVWLIIAALAMVWTVGEITSFVRLRVMAFTGEKIAMRLRMEIYAHMQKLSLAFFASRSTGSLITRVSSDTDRLWDFVTFGIIDMIVSVLQIVGVATALLLQDWSLALWVLMPLPLMTLMFYWHSKRIQSLYLRIWRKWSALTGVLSDVIPGMRVVKAFAREDHEVSRFEARNAALEQESETLHRQWTRFWPSVVMLMHTCSLIVWGLGAPKVLLNVQTHGAQGMPLGVFIAFTGYMWSFWGPVQQLGMMSRTVNRVTTSASRVFEVLDTVPAITNSPNAVVLSPLRGAVRFEHVSFSYDGVRAVLKDVSFNVQPGELIGLVGPSGGGKTTLINLVCRFYDVTGGGIWLDDAPLMSLELHSMRRQVGLVLQEPYLFHGTIAENIAYGADGADTLAIIDAARAANAHDFICGFPDGYETLVGERGQTLSGGERQRISIARAVLHNPRILILDEATSSVDTETESKIQEALHRLVAGRTTFAIAHRLSTLSRANRLLVMEGGRLVEQGTHQELLRDPNGVYTRLHQTQARLHAEIAV